MKKIMIALALTLTMGIGLCACGSSDSSEEDRAVAPEEETTVEETEAAAAAADFAGSSYNELAEYYRFSLDGKEYALPCTISEFTENGWYVPDELMNRELEGNTQVILPVYSDSSMDTSAFSIYVLNQGEETKLVKDCDYATGITLNSTDSKSSGFTLLKSGIAVDISTEEAARATADALTAYYGTDEDIFMGSDEDGRFNYRWFLSERVKANLNIDDGDYQKKVAGEDQTIIQNNSFTFEYNGPLE